MSEEIWLLRHGETEWTEQELHTGREDVPLSDGGREQASRAGRLLAGRSFDHVLVSPQTRARQTCELAGFADQAQVCEQLVEWDYGELEGMTDEQVRADRPGWNLFKDGAPGGESPDEVRVRVEQVIATVRELPGSCLLVGHGKTLRALGAVWVGLDIAHGAVLPMDPAAISQLAREASGPLLRLWNLTAELLPHQP